MFYLFWQIMNSKNNNNVIFKKIFTIKKFNNQYSFKINKNILVTFKVIKKDNYP